MTKTLKVGELASRTGTTVRTLHHYDEIGLLRPGGRTPAGHRLYGESEIRRLQQIASLRQLGLSLDEIQECLARPGYTLDRVLELQIERIESEISRHKRLKQLVQTLRSRLRSTGGVSLEELTGTIEGTMNFEKYYTPEQMDQLAAYGEAMDDGLDPASPEVQMLARRSAEEE